MNVEEIRSKRRKINDKIWVSAGAGFGASNGQCGLIPDTEANRDDRSPCPLCNDDECTEWPDVWLDNGNPAYHVSECEMGDGGRCLPFKTLLDQMPPERQKRIADRAQELLIELGASNANRDA